VLEVEVRRLKHELAKVSIAAYGGRPPVGEKAMTASEGMKKMP
jgi:hypothetical protein